jgi:hypothetical protein
VGIDDVGDSGVDMGVLVGGGDREGSQAGRCQQATQGEQAKGFSPRGGNRRGHRRYSYSEKQNRD